MSEDRRLILFARYPVPGRAKTRLIPALGAEGAAALHRRLVLRALRTARKACRAVPADLEVRFDGGTEAGDESLAGGWRAFSAAGRRRPGRAHGRRIRGELPHRLNRYGYHRQRLSRPQPGRHRGGVRPFDGNPGGAGAGPGRGLLPHRPEPSDAGIVPRHPLGHGPGTGRFVGRAPAPGLQARLVGPVGGH